MELYEYKKRNTPPYLTKKSPSIGAFSKKDCVLAIGLFDGVHLGHRALIERAKKEADKKGMPLGIFTFRGEEGYKSDPEILLSTESKCEVFERLGADFTVIADFDAVCDLEARDFVNDVLIGELGARICVVGYNFRFAKNATATADTLSLLMKEMDRQVITVDEFRQNGKEVSSSCIKMLIRSGKVNDAAVLLGAPYSVNGRVEHGRGFGRVLGFPTVNTAMGGGGVIPKKGVYHTKISVGDQLYTAITNVGSCPTFGERELHLESFILNFDREIYDENIKIYFVEYIREEIRFNSAEELKMQINVDINTIKTHGDISWQQIGQSLQ